MPRLTDDNIHMTRIAGSCVIILLAMNAFLFAVSLPREIIRISDRRTTRCSLFAHACHDL
ncbi:hypothetical protein [Legionella sp. 31fI33]|uniref:hypothetical protein n=1 Tax=Legionella sp. 31fI33 TaxID=2886376 RepID=UPI001E4911C5|nr:hypothetical protein [Legionella sp. 31fI33]MCC5013619.1 hypothetical protein [Legionella sp. 31fI33]